VHKEHKQGYATGVALHAAFDLAWNNPQPDPEMTVNSLKNRAGDCPPSERVKTAGRSPSLREAFCATLANYSPATLDITFAVTCEIEAGKGSINVGGSDFGPEKEARSSDFAFGLRRGDPFRRLIRVSVSPAEMTEATSRLFNIWMRC